MDQKMANFGSKKAPEGIIQPGYFFAILRKEYKMMVNYLDIFRNSVMQY